MLTVTEKAPAFLVACPEKRPVLAALHTQNQTLYIVEVSVKGGFKYALGAKQKAGYRWLISPTDKPTLWKTLQEYWNITVA